MAVNSAPIRLSLKYRISVQFHGEAKRDSAPLILKARIGNTTLKLKLKDMLCIARQAPTLRIFYEALRKITKKIAGYRSLKVSGELESLSITLINGKAISLEDFYAAARTGANEYDSLMALAAMAEQATAETANSVIPPPNPLSFEEALTLQFEGNSLCLELYKARPLTISVFFNAPQDGLLGINLRLREVVPLARGADDLDAFRLALADRSKEITRHRNIFNADMLAFRNLEMLAAGKYELPIGTFYRLFHYQAPADAIAILAVSHDTADKVVRIFTQLKQTLGEAQSQELTSELHAMLKQTEEQVRLFKKELAAYLVRIASQG